MDGVILENQYFWMEAHKVFGTYEQGKVLTEKYLHSDYDRLVEEVVVKLWKGKEAKPYYDLVNKSVKYLPGVKEVFKFIKEQGWITAIITGNSIDVARKVQHDLGIDHIYGNELVIKDGKVAGEFLWPIGEGLDKKPEIVKHLCEDLDIDPKEVTYIGDDKNDLKCFQLVGKSIAFNCKLEELKKEATHVVDSKDLSDILPLIKH